MKKIDFLSIGYVLLVMCGLGILVNGDRFKGALIPDTSFNHVQGKITMSRIGAYERRSRGTPFAYETAYYYDISYQYQVGEQHYSSKMINFDLPASQISSNVAQAYVRKYPLNATVTVFYKIDQPSFAVLEPRIKGRTPIVFIILVSSWLLGFIMVLTIHIKLIVKRIR